VDDGNGGDDDDDNDDDDNSERGAGLLDKIADEHGELTGSAGEGVELPVGLVMSGGELRPHHIRIPIVLDNDNKKWYDPKEFARHLGHRSVRPTPPRRKTAQPAGLPPGGAQVHNCFRNYYENHPNHLRVVKIKAPRLRRIYVDGVALLYLAFRQIKHHSDTGSWANQHVSKQPLDLEAQLGKDDDRSTRLLHLRVQIASLVTSSTMWWPEEKINRKRQSYTEIQLLGLRTSDGKQMKCDQYNSNKLELDITIYTEHVYTTAAVRDLMGIAKKRDNKDVFKACDTKGVSIKRGQSFTQESHALPLHCIMQRVFSEHAHSSDHESGLQKYFSDAFESGAATRLLYVKDITMQTPTKGLPILSTVSKKRRKIEHRLITVTQSANPSILESENQELRRKDIQQSRALTKVRARSKKKDQRACRLRKSNKGIRAKLKMALAKVAHALQSCVSAEKSTRSGGSRAIIVPSSRKGKQTPRQLQKLSTRGDRRHFTSKASLMMVMCRRKGAIAAGRVAAVLDVVTQNLATEPFSESWGSERTIIRAEKLVDQMELIFLSESLKKARDITSR
jgi:hypothetical protein